VLIGLLFVANSPAHDLAILTGQASVRAFVTPVVVHFGIVWGAKTVITVEPRTGRGWYADRKHTNREA
jgi:hypothetical protein